MKHISKLSPKKKNAQQNASGNHNILSMFKRQHQMKSTDGDTTAMTPLSIKDSGGTGMKQQPTEVFGQPGPSAFKTEPIFRTRTSGQLPACSETESKYFLPKDENKNIDSKCDNSQQKVRRLSLRKRSSQHLDCEKVKEGLDDEGGVSQQEEPGSAMISATTSSPLISLDDENNISKRRCLQSPILEQNKLFEQHVDCKEPESTASDERLLQLPDKLLVLDDYGTPGSNNMTIDNDNVKNAPRNNNRSPCVDMPESIGSDADGFTYKNKPGKQDINSEVDSGFCSQETDLVSSQSSAEAEEEGEEKYRVPYYLENFLIILKCVLNDEFFAYLFNEGDKTIIDAFEGLSESAQKLYVRLFGRNYRWIRQQKIVYPKIAKDLNPVLRELVLSKLIMDEHEMSDLLEVLETLPAPDLRTLGKTLKLSAVSTPRPTLIQAVMKHSRGGHIGMFFNKATNSTANTILSRARNLLGSCFKLDREVRGIFMRVMMLFGLHRTRGEDDDTGAGQQQLFQMLMSSIGQVRYPDYAICRQSRVFRHRDSLISFSQALQIESDIVEAMEQKDYTTATKIHTDCKSQAEQTLADKAAVDHDAGLPEHLRLYTAGAVYVRILSYGVELFQFTKHYTEAAEQLHRLLKQCIYRQDCRGAWYDRLALNLDFHLKKPEEALDAIQEALADKRVRTGHRYALLQRALRICRSGGNKRLKRRLTQFTDDGMNKLKEAPKVTIKAKQLPHHMAGANSMFISSESDEKGEDMAVLLRVEEVALAHYRQQGYPEGVHGEGSTFRSLMGLLFWDVLFMCDVPDAFYHHYQTHPLDLTTDSFYAHRKKAFDTRLEQIRRATDDELSLMVHSVWQQHEGTLCLGLNWALFNSADHAVGLVQCLGGRMLAGIMERLGQDLRHTTSGMPDLVVWNPEKHTVRLVEVKGPGDHLSTKQLLWLDHLLTLRVPAEVCHVIAVGAKKLH